MSSDSGSINSCVSSNELKDLESFLNDCYRDLKDDLSGKVADYIPYLSKVDPKKFAISLCTVDGKQINIGDYRDAFCLQSCSKPFSYCYAMKQHGRKKVHTHVGYEPTGVSFNSSVLNKDNIPHNPMVNAGAIMITSLLNREDQPSDRYNKVKELFEELCGDSKVGFNQSVFLSESEHADRNFSLAYKMREYNAYGFPRPSSSRLQKILNLYFQICSIEIDCQQGSVMAATLANGGICPTSSKRIFDTEIVRDCISLMFSCGMYDFSGEFGFDVGLPAKSGVSGSVMMVVPGKFGLCIWSPSLDKIGNSVRGVEICRRLSKNCNGNYHIFRHVGQHTKKKNNIDLPFYRFMEAIVGNDMEYINDHVENVNINLNDYDRRTFLHVACSEGKTEIIKILLDHNASPCTTDRWNNTPIDDLMRYMKGNTLSSDEETELKRILERMKKICHEKSLKVPESTES